MLSDNLAVAEFLATSHRALLDEQEAAWKDSPDAQKNAHRFAASSFQPVREILGRPLHVTSGFRCRSLNRLVGGHPQSYHLDGLAADVVPVGLDLRACMARLIEALNDGELPHVDKVILEHGRWLHIQAARDGREPRRQALVTHDGLTFALVADGQKVRRA